MAATEEVRRRYTLQFRVLNAAEGDLKKIVSAFGRNFGAIGRLVGSVVMGIGGAFAGLLHPVLAIVNTIANVFKAVTQAFRMAWAAVSKLIEIVKQAIQIGKAWQDSITLVSVATGKGAEVFEELSLKVAALGIGARQAAKGFEVLVRAGLTGTQAVEVFTDLALFSRAIGVEMRRTSQILVGAMAAFRKKASDAADVLKVFSFAILRTRFNFETFSTAFAFGGAAAAGFGQDLTETVAIMTKFFDMGLRASTVGTTMRNMLTRLAKPTREAQIALAQYGIAIENVNPATNKLKDILKTLIPLQGDLAAATTLFGRRTAGFIVNLLKELTKNGKAIEDVIEDINKSGDLITEAMQKRLQTLSGQMDRFGALWENFRVDVFRAVEPIARAIVQTLGDALSELRDNFRAAAPFITIFLSAMKSIGDDLIFRHIRDFLDFFGKIMDAATRGAFNFNAQMKSQTTILGKLTVPLKAAATLVAQLALGWRLATAAGKAMSKQGFILSMIMGNAEDRALAMADAVGDEKGLTLQITNFLASLAGLKVRINESFDTGQIERLRKEAKEMIEQMNASGAGIKNNMDKANIAMVKLTKTAGTLLIDLKKASSEGFGSFIKKVNEIRQKFGPALAGMFREAGEAFARGENISKMMQAIRDKMAQEESVLGIFFGQGPGERNKIIRDAVRLGDDVVERVGKTLINRPSVLVGALIGSKRITPAQRNQVEQLVGRVLDPFLRAVKESEEEYLASPAEAIQDALPQLKDALQTVIPEVDTLLKSFTKMDTASQQVFETWRKFNSQIALELIDHLDAQRKALKPDEWLRYARNLKLAGGEVVKAEAAIKKLSDVMRDRYTKELSNAVSELKKQPVELRNVTKTINEKAAAVLKAEQAWKSLDQGLRTEVLATFRELTAKMTATEIKLYSQELVQAAQAEKEWAKAMSSRQAEIDKAAGQFKTTFKNLYGPLYAQLITDKQLMDMKEHQAWIEDLTEKERLWNEYVTESKALYSDWLYSMSAEMRLATNAMFGGLKRAISAVARAFVDSSFDLKKSLRQIAKDVLAMLLEIIIQATIVKALFKGIFGASRGADIFFGVFGFQRGTALRGAAGSTDTVPALLTPGEIVLDKNASDAFREMIGGGGRPVGNTNIFEIHAMDGASVKRVVNKEVVPLLNRQLRTNTGIAPDVRMRSAKTLYKKGIR